MADTPTLAYQRTVVGYHGCDKETVRQVLKDETHLDASDNDYDWLGSGVYFWEFGPRRALEFAQNKRGRSELENPAVLGAYINLGRCFDLADVEHTRELGDAFERLQETIEQQGGEMPRNKKAEDGDDDLLLRHRDCAVIIFYMNQMDREADGDYHYQTVRGVFQEGSAAYSGAKIREKSHIQITVRDSECILGYFLPTLFFEKGGDDEQ